MDRTIRADQRDFAIRSTIYNLDSRNRHNLDDTDSNQFTIDVGSFDGPVRSIELLSAEIPNTAYVFTSENNDILFNEGAGTLTATISPGTYSVAEIETELKTKLDAAGTLTYTVSFDEPTKKLTISATGAFTLQFSQPASPYKELGWNNVDTVSASSHTAPNSINLAGENAWFISIRDFAQAGLQGGKSANGFTYKVPVNVSYGDIVFYTRLSGMDQQITQANTGFNQPVLFVQLVDYRGQLIDLQGRDWSFMIKVSSYSSKF